MKFDRDMPIQEAKDLIEQFAKKEKDGHETQDNSKHQTQGGGLHGRSGAKGGALRQPRGTDTKSR